MKNDSAYDVMCPDGTAFLQFVADNTDHDLATIDGKKTHHSLGSIAIANGNFSGAQIERNKIPREKWCQVESNVGIKIVQYFKPNLSALGETIIQPIVQVVTFLTAQP